VLPRVGALRFLLRMAFVRAPLWLSLGLLLVALRVMCLFSPVNLVLRVALCLLAQDMAGPWRVQS